MAPLLAGPGLPNRARPAPQRLGRRHAAHPHLQAPPHPGDPVVIELLGSIDLATRDLLVNAAVEVLATSQPVTIDARGVDFVDCTGISAFAEIAHAARREGVSFKLGPRSPQVQHVLDLVGSGEEWAEPPPTAPPFRVTRIGHPRRQDRRQDPLLEKRFARCASPFRGEISPS